MPEPKKDAQTSDAVANDAAADASVDAPADVVKGEGGCAKTCTELGFPCCWMAGCESDPMCGPKLCK